MPRKRKHADALAQYKARAAEQRIEIDCLRDAIYAELVRYAERLGEAELLRRLRIDYLDDSERVTTLDGRQHVPLTENHPTIVEIDACLAELASAKAAQ